MNSTRWLPLILMSCLLGCDAPTDSTSSSEAAGDGSAKGAGTGDFAPAVRACTRLHAECAGECGLFGYDCHHDVQSCTEQYIFDYTPTFDDPMIDEVRAQICAEQVEEQPCDWLEPDSLECEFAMLETCIDDSDAFGQPYSPFLAAPVDANTELVVELCPRVPEFFAVQLEAGDRIDVVRVDGGSARFPELLRLKMSSSGDVVLHEYRMEDPVPESGEYIVRLSSSERTKHAVSFTTTHEE